MNQYVVKVHRPVQWAIAIIALSAIIAIIVWIILDKSHWSVINQLFHENEVLRRVSEDNQELQAANQQLQEQTLMAAQISEMDRQTASLLQQEIKALQEEIFKHKQELEFYQNIMSGTGQSNGLNIQGLHIIPLPRQHAYRINLVLTHVTKSVKVAEGTIQISLEGQQDGEIRSIDLRKVALESALELSFKFRNFLKFESDLMLPEGFVPMRVSIQLQPKSKRQDRIKKTFDWLVK